MKIAQIGLRSRSQKRGFSRAKSAFVLGALCAFASPAAYAQGTSPPPAAPPGTAISPTGSAKPGVQPPAPPQPSAAPATAGTNDIVYMKNGSMMRGTIIEVVPGTRARIQLPTGETSTVKWSEIDHVAYAGQTVQGAPAGTAIVTTPLSTGSSTDGTKARFRVRATCGDAPRVLAGKEKLIVREITDKRDVTLSPVTSMYPDYKYDDATHDRKLTDPEFVEYEGEPGQHRIRLSAYHCNPIEQVINLTAGQVTPVNARLDAEVIPLVDVSLARPDFADASDTFEIRNEATVACATLPCTAKLPAKDGGFKLYWKRASGDVVIGQVPDPGAATKPVTDVAVEKKGTSMPGLITLALGGSVLAISTLAFVGDGNRGTCTYTSGSTSVAYKSDYFSGCSSTTPFVSGSVSTSQAFSGAGTAELATIGVSAAVTAVGIVLYALHIGSKESLFVNTATASSPSASAVADLKLRLTSGGIGGTF